MFSYIRNFVILYCIKNYMFVPVFNILISRIKTRTYEYLRDFFTGSTNTVKMIDN